MGLSARGAVGFGVVVALAVGCARVAPPPGGPMDTTGPSVIGVEPDSSATGIPVDSPIRIRFTEGVDRASLERALWVTPGGASKPRIDVSGEEATIRLGNPFPESTTVAVLLTTALQDKRREGRENRLERPARWIFSTGDSLWPGRLRGAVDRVGIPADQGLVLVALYADPGDTLPDPAETDPIAVAQADTSGAFDLDGLPVDGARYWLYALYDRDGNRRIAGTGEFTSAPPETVRLTPGIPEQSVRLRLVDPKAPGTVTGNLVKSAPDTVAVGIELYAADADSAASPLKRTQVGKDGTFTLSSVSPGTLKLSAYCDLDGNGRRDPAETVYWFGEIVVAPGSRRDLGEWSIVGCLP